VNGGDDEEDRPLLLSEPSVDGDGVYALDSLHHLQRILQRLQQQQFGFTALPTLVLVSSMSFSQSSLPYMVEYTGPLQTAHELYRSVKHYFGHLSLTAQPVMGGGVGSSGSSL